MAESAPQDLNSFDDCLAHWAAVRPDMIALEEGERRTTYAETERLTRQMIAFLQRQGIAHGDRIAWLGKNSDRYFLWLYAAGRMGVVMAPIGWRLAPGEIGYILEDTGAKLLFAAPEFVETARAVAGRWRPGRRCSTRPRPRLS